MRTRSLTIAVIVALVTSLLIPVFAGQPATAMPIANSSSAVLAQDDDAATPEDAGNEPADDQQGQGPGEGIELVPDLGDGGQPEGVTREIVIGDSRFLFDRIVPLSRQELSRIAQEQDVIAYAASETGPFDAVYLSVPNRSEDELARYLPERLESPETACPADAANYEPVDAGGTLYGFAGPETDLSTDTLQSVGDNNGEPVYADADAQQPFPELFFSSADGLLRFVILIEDGRPTSLADSLAFNGSEFSFDSDATDTIDPGTLSKVGCSTTFPVYAPSGATDTGFTELYVLVANRYLLFTGEGAAPSDPAAPTEEATPPPATPTEEATPEPTAVPTEVPTEVPPTEVLPTEVPTEVPPTAVPTDVPPTEVPPTEVPTEVPPTEVPPTEVPPTEVPTEVPPTEVPPTEVPTEVPPTEVPPTAAPTEAPPTDAPAVIPTEAPPTEAPATQAPATADAVPTEAPATEVPAEQATPPSGSNDVTASGAAPDSLPADAVAAGLPPEVTVQNNTYVFNQLNVDIDVSTLVQVEVQNIQGVDVTVYAEQNVEIGQAPRLYCVAANGAVVGQYVPVAPVAAPTVAPPAPVTPAPVPEEAAAAGLPPQVDIANNTYVFNQVNIDIDISTLVQVDVVTIQNVEVTVYAEQNVQLNQAPRLYLVGTSGEVVGQYVVAGTPVSTRPVATTPIAPPAVVPTRSPNAPPPAIATAAPRTTCAGEPGELNAQGLPSHLPNRVQLGGVAYSLVRVEEASAVGTLTLITCIGAFEAASTDQAEQSLVIFLRVSATSQQVYRFEAALTYQIEFQVSERPQTISTVDQRYQLRQVWQASVYSSTSVLLFVQDVANPAPEVFYGVNVSQTVVGDAIGEYRLPGETATASEEMVAAAERTGLNADLTIRGQVYILVNVYEPTGTTSNGFITLFGTAAEGDPAMLLGRDKRELELFVFEVDAPVAPSTPVETGG